MRRLVSALAMFAFLGSIAPVTASAMDKMSGSSMTMMKCAKGSTWVKGHMDKKTGKMTKGYCRKGTMSSM
jgi:hypothetical protein